MKWVLLNRTHINTNLVTAFWWEEHQLIVWFAGEPARARYRDPDRKLYVKLCHALGVRPEEVDNNGES